MQALLLCAGFGNRLGSLSYIAPKPLMPIHGHACLEYWLFMLKNSGFEEVFINTHYKHDLIVEYISRLEIDLKITIIYESKILGTAGAIRNILPKVAKDLFVLHCDNYGPSSLEGFVKFVQTHKKTNKLISGHFKTNFPEKCGILELDRDYVITSFIEKPTHSSSNLANAAIYYLSTQILNLIVEERMKDISSDLLPNNIVGTKSFCFEGLFIDVGDPLSLVKANLTHKEISFSENKNLSDWYKEIVITPVMEYLRERVEINE